MRKMSGISPTLDGLSAMDNTKRLIDHGLLTGLMDAHVSLSTDGTTVDGLECLLAMHQAARDKKTLHALN